MIRSIEVSPSHVVERPSVHVRVVSDDGHTGYGEAAPLPGYSPDDAAGCHAALSGLARAELEHSTPWEAGALIPESLPAARFALETALLDLQSRRAGRPAWQLLAEAAFGEHVEAAPVPLSLLVTGHDAEALREAACAAVARGFRTLKLKVGRGLFAEELATARRVRKLVGSGIALRLDANRAWSISEARDHLMALRELDPELVEEPTTDLLALGQSAVPLALDESLQQVDALERLRPVLAACRVCAVVLKPTTLGGFQNSIALARRARASGLDVTVSHTFEGPIAFSACCALALAIASRQRASGLAPHAALGDARIAALSAGALHAWSLPGLGLQP